MAENIDNQGYQVLARKYRSKNFKELKGQDVLVQTLTNAIEQGKIAHAYMLTGVRGVGKTSSARIFAKALNCIGADGKTDHPVIEPCGVCENCKAIEAGNHMDVIEMDAASHTGVDDVRKIIEEVQYKPAIGRYKIYIIDEVHMLSKNAFNALLKTLEEPPAHAKFIFATTEINKVPITILSRCQKFNLARVEVPVLIQHFKEILDKENVKFDQSSLEIIARVSGGSVRDGLSLLDQAILNSDGEITEEKTKHVLGISDRGTILKIFESIVNSDIQNALKILEELYKKGADTFMILTDLMEYTHNIIKLKVIPTYGEHLPITKEELVQIEKFSKELDVSKLINLWQVFTKGFDEMKSTDKNFQTLEMILVKASFISAQPSIEKIMEKIENNELQIEGQKKNIDNNVSEKNIDSTGFSQQSPKNSPQPPKVEFEKIDFQNADSIKILYTKLSDDKEELLANLVSDFFIFGSFSENENFQQLKINLKSGYDKNKLKTLQNYVKNNYKLEILIDDSIDGKTLTETKKEEDEKTIQEAKDGSSIMKGLMSAFKDLSIAKIEDNE